MRKRLFAGLLSCIMLLSLLPTSVFAVENGGQATPTKSVSTDASSPVQIRKEVNNEGTALTLEAYLTNEVTQTVSAKPLDIVLVLDQSGSMAYNFDGKDKGDNTARRQYAMKLAVANFIDKVGEQYSEKGDHRMAIVTFDSNAETLQGWTVVDAAGKSSLKNAVGRLPQNPAGATNVGAGMQAAETLMGSGYAYAGSNMERQKVVIVFTDGVPTTERDFNTNVANTAITAAKSMKDDGVTVYTVGIFNGADPAQLYGNKWSYGILDDVPCTGEVGSCWGGSWLVDLFGQNDFDAIDVPAALR